MEQYGTPKPIKANAISGVEFGTIPEQFNKQDVFNGTVKALLDLKSLVDEELAHNHSLSHELKKRLERAQTDVHLFFSSIIGLDYSQNNLVFNSQALRIKLEDIPENVFRSLELLCDTIPAVHTLIMIDPKSRTTSETFPENYHLLYLMVQKAIRELAKQTNGMKTPSPLDIRRAKRVEALLDTRPSIESDTRIDRSKPFHVKLEDITPDRMRISADNLVQLLEKKEEDLPKELKKELQTVLSFLRALIAPDLIDHKKYEKKATLKEEAQFLERYHKGFTEHPDELRLSEIPNHIIEAVSKLGMFDHELHLAFLGHNIENLAQIIDPSTGRVSSFDRPYAYHALTLATYHTMKREEAGIVPLQELYKLDDMCATPEKGLVDVVSATEFSNVAQTLGMTTASPKSMGKKVWDVLTTPIGELWDRQKQQRRDARLRKQVDRIVGLLSNEQLVKNIVEGNTEEVFSIFKEVESNEQLQVSKTSDAMIGIMISAAENGGTGYAQFIKNELHAHRRKNTIFAKLYEYGARIKDISKIAQTLKSLQKLSNAPKLTNWVVYPGSALGPGAPGNWVTIWNHVYLLNNAMKDLSSQERTIFDKEFSFREIGVAIASLASDLPIGKEMREVIMATNDVERVMRDYGQQFQFIENLSMMCADLKLSRRELDQLIGNSNAMSNFENNDTVESRIEMIRKDLGKMANECHVMKNKSEAVWEKIKETLVLLGNFETPHLGELLGASFFKEGDDLVQQRSLIVHTIIHCIEECPQQLKEYYQKIITIPKDFIEARKVIEDVHRFCEIQGKDFEKNIAGLRVLLDQEIAKAIHTMWEHVDPVTAQKAHTKEWYDVFNHSSAEFLKSELDALQIAEEDLFYYPDMPRSVVKKKYDKPPVEFRAVFQSSAESLSYAGVNKIAFYSSSHFHYEFGDMGLNNGSVSQNEWRFWDPNIIRTVPVPGGGKLVVKRVGKWIQLEEYNKVDNTLLRGRTFQMDEETALDHWLFKHHKERRLYLYALQGIIKKKSEEGVTKMICFPNGQRVVVRDTGVQLIGGAGNARTLKDEHTKDYFNSGTLTCATGSGDLFIAYTYKNELTHTIVIYNKFKVLRTISTEPYHILRMKAFPDGRVLANAMKKSVSSHNSAYEPEQCLIVIGTDGNIEKLPESDNIKDFQIMPNGSIVGLSEMSGSVFLKIWD